MKKRPFPTPRVNLITCGLFLIVILFISAAVPVQAQTLPGQSRLIVSYPSNLYLSPQQIQKKIRDTVAVFLIAYLLLFVVVRVINRRVADIKVRHTLRKQTVYVINFLFIIGLILIWLQNIGSITILLGFVSAGLALALQEVILSIAGWLLIVTRRPFEAGDRIEFNGVQGDVIDIRMFQTSLLEIGNWVKADQSTGRIVNIPNSFVFKSQHYNYSRGFEFIWNEIPILITFESDWQKAHDLLMDVIQHHERGLSEKAQRKIEAMKNRYMIFYGKLTPIVYVNIKDSGVELTIRYLTEAKTRRSTQDKICREVLKVFAREPDINFAYPTYRIVKN